MSKKTPKIADLIRARQGCTADAHYLGFFDCFNDELYFEAHEVLEELWLEDRNGPNGAFYKGLIQLAGAFVHLQKSRPGPAAALLRLTQNNLRIYPAAHEYLNIQEVLALTDFWLNRLAENRAEALARQAPPKLTLRAEAYLNRPPSP